MNHTAHPEKPLKIGIIGGSGLGDTFGPPESAEGKAAPVVHDLDTPFGKPSGPITVVEWSGVEVCLLKRHGPGHVLNPTAVPYRANIYAMKALGVTHLLASGATGSLREHLHPGELVIADQVMDKTHKRPITFIENAAVHVEYSQPFCPVMRNWLLDAAQQLPAEGEDGHVHVHDGGTYVCMEGPVFSTRAESEWHRQLGGDLIGMTAMPEERLAREAELAYAMIAMPTDYAAWREPPPGQSKQQLLQEIIGNLQRATEANLSLKKAALKDVSQLKREASPAHTALDLGIWSDKAQIDPEAIERLRPLWGRHFG